MKNKIKENHQNSKVKDLDELPGFSKILIKMVSDDFKKEIKNNKSGSISKLKLELYQVQMVQANQFLYLLW